MSPEQWAAASVVGAALEGRLSPLKEPERNGELWLRDVHGNEDASLGMTGSDTGTELVLYGRRLG